MSPAHDRPAERRRTGRASEETHCRKESTVRKHRQAGGRKRRRQQRVPAQCPVVRQVQHQGRDQDGWVYDVFELWRFKVRLIAA